MCDPPNEKKLPVSKAMPLTTEEPVRRPWLSDQLNDINLVDSADSPSPSPSDNGSSPPPSQADPTQQDEATNDDDSEDTDMENEIVSDDQESDESEPTVVSPPITTTAPTTSIHPSSSKTTTATSSDMATAQGTAQDAKKNGPVPTQFLRHGSSQMDFLWNEMEQHQWDNADDGFWGEDDGDDSSDLDDELKKVTEANRHIDFDDKQTPQTTKSMHDPTLRQLLVFAQDETIIQPDRQCRTFVYGAGPTGDQVKTAEGIVANTERKSRREYLIACDFSRESLHAMEWTMGTMLRDHDALHIVTVANREDNPDIVSQSNSSVDSDLESSLNAVVDEAKKRLERMMLYDVKLVCYSMVGRVKDVLKHLIRTLPLTMVVCGSRGRGTMKGLLMGSVSTYLVHKSLVPVAVIRPQKKKKKEPRHVITATPLSESMKSGHLHADELG
ncbi:hypothetical protein [Absidia glauca]|uniref:UspA domain-containing protein n=1 Tax=Absidia glauca TaxID=4829 RepID=A0A168SR77_ABSGL|nr:hypothetical protein [Absidia glauca]